MLGPGARFRVQVGGGAPGKERRGHHEPESQQTDPAHHTPHAKVPPTPAAFLRLLSDCILLIDPLLLPCAS